MISLQLCQMSGAWRMTRFVGAAFFPEMSHLASIWLARHSWKGWNVHHQSVPPAHGIQLVDPRPRSKLYQPKLLPMQTKPNLANSISWRVHYPDGTVGSTSDGCEREIIDRCWNWYARWKFNLILRYFHTKIYDLWIFFSCHSSQNSTLCSSVGNLSASQMRAQLWLKSFCIGCVKKYFVTFSHKF